MTILTIIIKSLRCIPQTHAMLYVNYLIFKRFLIFHHSPILPHEKKKKHKQFLHDRVKAEIAPGNYRQVLRF